VSGFFGIFANGGLAKVIMYLYSVFATFAFAWGLYGVLVVRAWPFTKLRISRCGQEGLENKKKNSRLACPHFFSPPLFISG